MSPEVFDDVGGFCFFPFSHSFLVDGGLVDSVGEE